MRTISVWLVLGLSWLTVLTRTAAAEENPKPIQDDCSLSVAPESMVCIPAGTAIIGSDDETKRERPQHQVRVSQFFIDQNEVTNRDYRACQKAGVCPRRKGLPRSYRPFLAPELPAIPISWRMAHKYCVWAGKRLPTEAEWEKVARGGEQGLIYPWGNTEPTCALANYNACSPHITQPVGGRPAGAYNVYDMAGNGYEWVNDWASDCFEGCAKPCGEACRVDNPQGPCFGSPSCAQASQRLLKGGSWYWPEKHLRGSWRRAQKPHSGLHRFSFRCASDSATLTTAPYWHERRRNPLPPLNAPSASELEKFRAVRDDTDILKIQECSRDGLAQHDCRDPISYYRSNEQRRGVFGKYIENLGGGYVGVGADQSYDFIASAKSRWAWIFDYDPIVVRIHYIIRAVVLQTESPEDFIDAFRLRNLRQTKQWVRDSLGPTHPELRRTLRVLVNYQGKLRAHYLKSVQGYHVVRDFGWLSDADRYAYIRTMFEQGRVLIRKGNLLTDVALPDISKSARTLGVSVRVYYPSNADDQWDLTSAYRSNLGLLPFDDKSVVIRTLYGERFKLRTKWLYTVHAGLHMQRMMRRNHTKNVGLFLHEAQDTRRPFLRLIGMPQAARGEATASREPRNP